MSTVGRIFIVLNLVLTFVLVGFVGALNYSGAKYRAAYERLQKNGEEQLTRWNQEIAGKSGQVKDLEGENTSLKAQIALHESRWNDLYNAYMAEKGASLAVAENYNTLAQKFEGWDGIYTDLTGKIEEFNGQIDELKRKQVQAAESERIARNREVTAAAFRVRADVEKKALIDQIAMMNDVMESKDAELAVYMALHGPIVAPPIGLVGRVVSVSTDGQIATVELSGLAGEQAKTGWQLALYSETQFKGFVRISEVHGDGSVTVTMVYAAPGAEAAAPGDRVKPVVFS